MIISFKKKMFYWSLSQRIMIDDLDKACCSSYFRHTLWYKEHKFPERKKRAPIFEEHGFVIATLGMVHFYSKLQWKLVPGPILKAIYIPKSGQINLSVSEEKCIHLKTKLSTKESPIIAHFWFIRASCFILVIFMMPFCFFCLTYFFHRFREMSLRFFGHCWSKT